jgi:hypothetical protein
MSDPTNIPTPLTDAELLSLKQTHGDMWYVPLPGFARTLEREIVRLKEEQKLADHFHMDAETELQMYNASLAELTAENTRLKELNAFVTKGSFEASRVMAKENSHVRFKNEELKTTISELTSALKGALGTVHAYVSGPSMKGSPLESWEQALTHATACLKERKE